MKKLFLVFIALIFCFALTIAGEKETSVSKVRLYPNPYIHAEAQDNYLYLDNLPSHVKVTFFSINGRSMYEITKNDESALMKIDIKNNDSITFATSGKYILQVHDLDTGAKKNFKFFTVDQR